MEPVYTPVVGVARIVFFIQGLKFTVTGAEHIPRSGGAVLAMNHIGYMDFTYAGLAARPSKRLVRFMAKAEVFKPKVDSAGARMIMSLITSIHTYRPFNLFLIVTMRSEELHRCSEFLGVTEVVNSSMYLVDLIGGRDIEQGSSASGIWNRTSPASIG